MDKKIFISSFFFFLVVLVNPRDFPLTNIPCIYPAFLVVIGFVGIRNIISGIKKTWFLQLLIIVQWFYLVALKSFQGHSLKLGEIPYLIEPLLILSIAGGVATYRPGGPRIGIVALLSAVSISAGCGLWIHFIGEPIKSLYSILQRNAKGTIVEIITVLREHSAMNGRAGLALHIFLFSFQNAIALSLISANLLDPKRPAIKNYFMIAICFIILFVAMVICAERATVGSVLIGLLFYLALTGRKIINLRSIFGILIISLAAFFILQYMSKTNINALQHRSLNEIRLKTRLLIMPIAAIETIFYQPCGAAGMSQHYKKIAREKHYRKYGKAVAPHNHYANTIMYTGMMGVILVCSLFWGLATKILFLKKIKNNGVELLLATACITALVHATTHNAGFFKLEPSTLIVFGLLWGACANSNKISNKVRESSSRVNFQEKLGPFD